MAFLFQYRLQIVQYTHVNYYTASMRKLKDFLILQILEEYNEQHKAMNLVLFDDALEHLTRIHRVIRMDQGHALLVGVGGSGRQSLARLGAFAAGCEVFEITLSRGYGEEEFREDLKALYNKLGIENKKVFVYVFYHSTCTRE